MTRPSLTGVFLAGLIVLHSANGVLPRGINIAVEVSVLGVAGFLVIIRPRALSGRVALLVCLTVLVYLGWIAQMANANTPSVEAGLLGLRKSVSVLGFLTAGLVLRPKDAAFTIRFVSLLLVASAALHLAIHLFAPGIEASVARAADQYTGELGGQPRLQGTLSGPFHAAMLGVVVVYLGSARISPIRPTFRLPAISLGVAVVLESLVRTGLAAVMLIGACLALAQISSLRSVLLRFLMSVACLLASFAASLRVVPGLISALLDQRFTQRFGDWQESLGLIWERPVFGWGAGAAGDTLAPLYEPHFTHITTHSMFFKYLVEGGVLLGSLVTAAILLAVGTAIGRPGHLLSWYFVPVMVVLFFGLTSSAVDAAPVSTLSFVLLGAGIASSSLTDSALESAGQSLRRLSAPGIPGN